MSHTLHIYAQGYWHGDAFIVGTREALVALRDAIDGAIANGSADCESSVNDGEGFRARVLQMDEGQLQKLEQPYIETLCNNQGIHPSVIYGKLQEKVEDQNVTQEPS